MDLTVICLNNKPFATLTPEQVAEHSMRDIMQDIATKVGEERKRDGQLTTIWYESKRLFENEGIDKYFAPDGVLSVWQPKAWDPELRDFQKKKEP